MITLSSKCGARISPPCLEDQLEKAFSFSGNSKFEFVPFMSDIARQRPDEVLGVVKFVNGVSDEFPDVSVSEKLKDDYIAAFWKGYNCDSPDHVELMMARRASGEISESGFWECVTERAEQGKPGYGAFVGSRADLARYSYGSDCQRFFDAGVEHYASSHLEKQFRAAPSVWRACIVSALVGSAITLASVAVAAYTLYPEVREGIRVEVRSELLDEGTVHELVAAYLPRLRREIELVLDERMERPEDTIKKVVAYVRANPDALYDRQMLVGGLRGIIKDEELMGEIGRAIFKSLATPGD